MEAFWTSAASVRSPMPLHAACRSGDLGGLWNALLLPEEAKELNARDPNGDTPLNLVARWVDFVDGLLILLQHGVDVHSVDSDAKTALHVVEAPEAASLLIQRGTSLNQKDVYGWTPLHWAVMEGRLGVAHCLIDSGADVAASADLGFPLMFHGVTRTAGLPWDEPYLPMHMTALHIAFRTGCPLDEELIQHLISKGANVRAEDSAGKSPVDYALERCRGLSLEQCVPTIQRWRTEATSCRDLRSNRTAHVLSSTTAPPSPANHSLGAGDIEVIRGRVQKCSAFLLDAAEREVRGSSPEKVRSMSQLVDRQDAERDMIKRFISTLEQKLMQRHEEQRRLFCDSKDCKVCMDAIVDTVLLECGHAATCEACARQLQLCPICREPVLRVVRTYWA